MLRTDSDFLFVVPAGGIGSRMGVLTENQAKPSLPVSFDPSGEITRMIDIPLQAVRGVGGRAVVSAFYRADSLRFVNGREGVTLQNVTGCQPFGSDMKLARDAVGEKSPALIGFVPADAHIQTSDLELMIVTLMNSRANAVQLATRNTFGHQTHNVDRNNAMVSQDRAHDTLGSLGVHLFRTDWLLDRMNILGEATLETAEVWDFYGREEPEDGLLMCVPVVDTGWIDMGTPSRYAKVVYDRNAEHTDASENIVFPGARLRGDEHSVIALPNAMSGDAFRSAILPEGMCPKSNLEVLFYQIEQV